MFARRLLEDVLQTSCEDVLNTPLRWKMLRWKRLQDFLKDKKCLKQETFEASEDKKHFFSVYETLRHKEYRDP